jgi:hypothetical protein
MDAHPDVTLDYQAYLTLMAVLMTLLQRTGGSLTIRIGEANALFDEYRLGINRTDNTLHLALVTPERAQAMQQAVVDMTFLKEGDET